MLSLVDQELAQIASQLESHAGLARETGRPPHQARARCGERR
jgi:hypothetical protein